MRHAYGAADEVPFLLRGLVESDPAIRETALDAMYGAVHHQGDVYDSTVAAIPFLVRIAGTPGLPGRPEVIALLGSIGGAKHDDVDPADLDLPEVDDPAAHGYLFADGNALVVAEYPLWMNLLRD